MLAKPREKGMHKNAGIGTQHAKPSSFLYPTASENSLRPHQGPLRASLALVTIALLAFFLVRPSRAQVYCEDADPQPNKDYWTVKPKCTWVVRTTRHSSNVSVQFKGPPVATTDSNPSCGAFSPVVCRSSRRQEVWSIYCCRLQPTRLRPHG
jgi:hypothetical protein